MPILPSGGARWVDDSRGASTVRPLVYRETSPGVIEVLTTGPATHELVDVTGTGVFETVAIGTAPAAARVVARQVNGDNIIVY